MLTSIPIGKAGRREVYLDPERRKSNLHVIGGPNQGKSKFLEHMIREDILAGHGVCLIDPHGEIFHDIVAWCASFPVESFRRIHILDPGNLAWCTGFNPLRSDDSRDPSNRVEHMIEALAQVWGGEDSHQTPSIRTVLRAIFTVLIERGYTLAEAFPLTLRHDAKDFRAFVTDEISNPIIREVWEAYKLSSQKTPREFEAEFGGARRRLIELLSKEQLRTIFGMGKGSIDFRRAMDNDEIVLINLSEGGLEESQAQALGALLIREMFIVAKQRKPKYADDHPFYLYIDECAEYLTGDVNKLLAQTRKFGLRAILAHQWLEQLRIKSEANYAAIMQIPNKVVFGGLSDADAVLMADELFRTEYDIEMPVERLIKPTVVGYAQTWLHHWSESITEGDVSSDGGTAVSSASSSESQQFDADGFPIGGVVAATGKQLGDTRSKSSAQVAMSGHTSGESEAYLPQLENLPTAVHSLDNVRHLAVKRLRSLPRQHAIVKGQSLPSFDMTPFDIEPTHVHPDSMKRFMDRVMDQSPYAITASEATKVIELRAHQINAEIVAWKMPPPPVDDDEQFYGKSP